MDQAIEASRLVDSSCRKLMPHHISPSVCRRRSHEHITAAAGPAGSCCWSAKFQGTFDLHHQSPSCLSTLYARDMPMARVTWQREQTRTTCSSSFAMHRLYRIQQDVEVNPRAYKTKICRKDTGLEVASRIPVSRPSYHFSEFWQSNHQGKKQVDLIVKR